MAELTSAEATIFGQYQDCFIGRHVLDLGVGCGRTTPILAPSAASYVGIDYSRSMIDQCAWRFPNYRFEHADARDLSRFPSATFDFVMFSFNGIDFVNHTGRMTVLREVARVLAPGGVYAFSSHSLGWAQTRARWNALRRTGAYSGPFAAARRLRRVGLRFYNYARHRHLQQRERDHAIMLDPGHDFTLPMYYITPSEQQRQLQAAGFHPDSRVLPEYSHDDTADDRMPYAYYYIARKI